jgi:pimeloyl-ACP methyl ester carboxylesterase
MRSSYCSVAVLALALAAGPGLAQTATEARTAGFTVFVQGVSVGVEKVTVTRSPQGITITGEERIGPPIRLTTSRAEVRYTPDWQPLGCVIEGRLKDDAIAIRASVSGAHVTSDYRQGEKSASRTDQVPVNIVLLPNVFFGSYEALAARLAGARAGDRIDIYVPPVAAAVVTVKGVADDRVRTPAGPVEIRRYELQIDGPEGPIGVELWANREGHLLRLSLPSQAFDLIRTDLASVASRREPIARPNDESVQIPANGFSLTGTLSKPAAGRREDARLPAVVLVSGSASTDRDEVLAGIPVFGQLASALADAGYVVLRYDKRGVGQSGGRAENTTVQDYAEDAIAAVKFLERRDDVDRRRIAMVGYGEGGAVAAVAASRSGAIHALVLVAAPGATGSLFVLEQQQHLLDLMKVSDAERRAKIEQQKRLHEAVLTGRGLDALPDDLRRSADTPWFRSFLSFDPSQVIRKCDQPILILQGTMDREVAPVNADRLEAIARSRKGRAGQAVRLVRLAGLNHLLVPAPTGELDEYDHLAAGAISPEVAAAVDAWLKDVMGTR